MLKNLALAFSAMELNINFEKTDYLVVGTAINRLGLKAAKV